jgi:hypothetical protein
MILPRLSGDAWRVLVKNHTATRAQSRLLTQETSHDTADIGNFAPAQSKHIARTCQTLLLGSAVFRTLLRPRRGQSCDQDDDDGNGQQRKPAARCSFVSAIHDAPFMCPRLLVVTADMAPTQSVAGMATLGRARLSEHHGRAPTSAEHGPRSSLGHAQGFAILRRFVVFYRTIRQQRQPMTKP